MVSSRHKTSPPRAKPLPSSSNATAPLATARTLSTSPTRLPTVHQSFTPNTDLAAEFDELKPQSGEKVISKQQPSCYAGTDLDEYLKGLGDVGKKVVLTGYMAHVCVSTTARAAAERGYDVILAEGAIGDRDIPGGLGGEELTSVALERAGGCVWDCGVKCGCQGVVSGLLLPLTEVGR